MNKIRDYALEKMDNNRHEYIWVDEATSEEGFVEVTQNEYSRLRWNWFKVRSRHESNG